MITRAVRGAVTVDDNNASDISNATLELLQSIVSANQIAESDIISVIFTLTPDLNAEFPAKTARTSLGWDSVPMICTCEIPVPNSIEKCIRVMITFNTYKNQNEIKHIYLGKAQELRPDLS